MIVLSMPMPDAQPAIEDQVDGVAQSSRDVLAGDRPATRGQKRVADRRRDAAYRIPSTARVPPDADGTREVRH
jgi:hypothetical protein